MDVCLTCVPGIWGDIACAHCAQGRENVRRAARTDDNQQAIVDALRKAGASVQSLAAIGKGCPDLLVGCRGKNVLMEIKNENRPPSKQRLTTDEKVWHDSWRGSVAIVKNVNDALQAMEFLS